MNIVIIGPGKDPERYGNYFCKRAKEDGHTIHKYSYRIVPGLSEPEDIIRSFLPTKEKLIFCYTIASAVFIQGMRMNINLQQKLSLKSGKWA